MYDVAGVLSTQPGLTASVACYAGALRGTDSAQPPLQLRLNSPAACECLLVGALRMLAHCLQLRPLLLGGDLAPGLLERAISLLLSSSQQVQAGAMRFLATALAAAPLVAFNPPQLLDAAALMLQQHSAAPRPLACGWPAAAEQPAAAIEAGEEWWQALLGLLRVLHDGAIAAAAAQLLPRIHSLAVAAALGCGAASSHAADLRQLAFCQPVRGTLLAQPALLEGSTHLLRLFPHASPAVRQLLLECVALYLQQQQQLCGEEAVRAAFVKAAVGAGLSAEVRVCCC